MKAISLLIFLISCSTYQHDESQKILQESLRQCYVESDSYTGKDGKVQGSMKVVLQVAADGKITSCQVKENLFRDPNLTACVCDVFKRGTIPHTSGKTIEVVQPVNFFPVAQ